MSNIENTLRLTCRFGLWAHKQRKDTLAQQCLKHLDILNDILDKDEKVYQMQDRALLECIRSRDGWNHLSLVKV